MTLAKMMKILSEKDPDKKKQMIDALSEKDKEAFLKEAEKIHQEAEKLHTK